MAPVPYRIMVGSRAHGVHSSSITLPRVSREITLTTDRFPGKPGFDAAVSRAVLGRVASGDLPETLRLYVPERLVAFGSRDAVEPAYQAATRAAAAAGFGAYLRLAGGRAAVFHEHTISFGWAIPTPDPRSTIEERFGEIGGILTAALESLGVDARVGEITGEYCAGTHSINAGGRTKLIGIGPERPMSAGWSSSIGPISSTGPWCPCTRPSGTTGTRRRPVRSPRRPAPMSQP